MPSVGTLLSLASKYFHIPLIPPCFTHKIHNPEQLIQSHLTSNNSLPPLSFAWLARCWQWQPSWQSTAHRRTPCTPESVRSGVRRPRQWEANHQQLPSKGFGKESQKSVSYSTGAQSEMAEGTWFHVPSGHWQKGLFSSAAYLKKVTRKS